MNWSAVAPILLGLAVILGAFGAHGLRGRLDAYSMNAYERAVFFHFIYAIRLLIFSLLRKTIVLSESGSSWVCTLLFAGILIFSGSLSALALSGVRVLGAITPLGGLSFVAGWFLLAYLLVRGGSK